ncbi:MAG: Hpt domain-containing protein [Planctomycetaceae bacterium]
MTQIDTPSDTQTPVFSEFANEPDFLEILVVFAKTMQEKRDILQKLLDDRDFVQMKFQAHQIKGAGGGYGFSGLSARAAELEAACEAQQQGAVESALDGVLRYMARIRV